MFALSGFLVPFIGGAINLALPIIGQEFGMNIVSLGWVATVFFLSTAVFLVPLGRLADILGRRKIFITGITIFTLTSILCSCALSGAMLIFARGVQGLGGAMIFGTSMAILVSMFPPKERGRAIGMQVSGVYIGSSLGPVLGGLITQYLGWRYIFVLVTILGTIIIGMSIKYLKDEWAHANGESFDLKGSIAYALGVISILYGSTMLPALSGFFVMGTGILLFIIFCIMQEHTHHPVFDIKLLSKNRQFAMANLAALLNFSAAFAVPFIMSLYLQYIRGLQPNQAGLIMLVSAVTMAIGAPIAGRLSDHKDPRIIASIGMALCAAALFTLNIILNMTTPFTLIVLLMFMFGSGMSLFGTPNTHAAMEAVTPRHLGIASSLISTMRVFGQTLSMGISMLVLTLVVGKVKISYATLVPLMKSAKIIFFVFGLLCIAGIFASLARGKRNLKPEEKI